MKKNHKLLNKIMCFGNNSVIHSGKLECEVLQKCS